MPELIDYTEINEIELVYTTHFQFTIDELDNKYHWTKEAKEEGKHVVKFWIKYGTLVMVLDNGDIIEEYLPNSADMHDNVNSKWPYETFLKLGERWIQELEEE